MKKLYFILLLLLGMGRLSAQCNAGFGFTADGDGGYWLQADSVGDSTTLYTWQVWHDSTAITLDSVGRHVFYEFPANDTFSVCLHVTDTVNACNSDTCMQFIVTERYVPLLDSINRWVVHNSLCFVLPSENHSSRDDCDYGQMHWWLADEYTANRDTVIDSVSYRVVENIFSSLFPPATTYTCLFGYVREDVKTRKVYFRDKFGSAEKLLYNFGLTPGDSFYVEFFNPNLGSFETGFYHLAYTSEMEIAGGKRRTFYLTPPHNGHPTMVWIEGVGFLGTPFYSYTFSGYSCGGYFCNSEPNNDTRPNDFASLVTCFTHANWVYFDTCSYQQALQYQGPCYAVYDSCNYGQTCGSVDEVAALASFDVSPNPASSVATVYLQVKQPGDFTLELQDLTGKVVLPQVLSGKLHEGTQQYTINVQVLPSGTYLLACKTPQGALYRKLMITR